MIVMYFFLVDEYGFKGWNLGIFVNFGLISGIPTPNCHGVPGSFGQLPHGMDGDPDTAIQAVAG